MSKFDLEDFLDGLCKHHAHLNGLYSLIKKYKFEKILANKGNFTFVMPMKKTIENLKSKPAKSIKKTLINMFVPGKFKTASSWPEKVHGIANHVFTVKSNQRSVDIGSKRAEFIETRSGVPIWGIKSSIKTGGAFKADSEIKDQESFLNFARFEEILNNGGFKGVVVKIYESLSEDDKAVADCFINGHPLAETFLLYDSPFINNSQTTVESDDKNYDEEYNKLCSKPGKYLINSKNDEVIIKLIEQLKDATIIDDTIDTFYSDLESNGGKATIDEKEVEIVCPTLAPYLQRISLFVLMLEEFQKIINDEEKSVVDKYAAFTGAFTLNATTDLKVSYEDFKGIKEVDEILQSNTAIFSKCGLILFKSDKVMGAKEKKKKQRHVIKLTPANRKILTSSATKNK